MKSCHELAADVGALQSGNPHSCTHGCDRNRVGWRFKPGNYRCAVPSGSGQPSKSEPHRAQLSCTTARHRSMLSSQSGHVTRRQVAIMCLRGRPVQLDSIAARLPLTSSFESVAVKIKFHLFFLTAESRLYRCEDS